VWVGGPPGHGPGVGRLRMGFREPRGMAAGSVYAEWGSVNPGAWSTQDRFS